MVEQLLMRLLIENLDKLGDAKEGEIIVKNLNASMLRMLDNCDPSIIFCVLFKLLRKYKDYRTLPKLADIIIKCLLKLSKVLEKLTDQLDVERILLVIHEYLQEIDDLNKSRNDEMGSRICKTVVNELVKLKFDQIWDDYRVVEDSPLSDHHIQRWITVILRSMEPQD